MRKAQVVLLIVAAASSVLLAGCPFAPRIVTSATSHHFGVDPNTNQYETSWSFQVWNGGIGRNTLVFTVETDKPWLSVTPTTGQSTGKDDKVTITVTITRTKSTEPQPDFASGNVIVKSSTGKVTIPVTTAPNYFTMEFTNGNDLDGAQLTFTPGTGLSYYDANAQENVTSFPTNSTNAWPLSFTDLGDPIHARTWGDKKVPFYGRLYGNLYISSKGWISFGEPGHDPTSIEDHFRTPQISVLPMDADSVKYQQDSEKLIITYEGADSPAKAGGPNDVQVELYFDGRIRITYLNVDPTISGIVGLSLGGFNGIRPRDFIRYDWRNSLANTKALSAEGME